MRARFAASTSGDRGCGIEKALPRKNCIVSQQKLLIAVLRILNERSIQYMLTGSVVSSIQGEPRLSHDIDIIIIGDYRIGKILLDHFSPNDFYLDDQAVREAIQAQGMFNLIDIASGDKVDFWLLTDDAFDESRFQRRLTISLFGETAWISTPEDTILAKILWAKKSGGSEKQMLDALRVFEVNAPTIDRLYIEKWCRQLGLQEYWNSLLERTIRKS
jgi:hypothetical protein